MALPIILPLDEAGTGWCEFDPFRGDEGSKLQGPPCGPPEVTLEFDVEHPDGLKQNFCIPHAAYTVAEALCRELGTERVKLPAGVFVALVEFFEEWVRLRLSLEKLQPSGIN